MSNTSFDPGVLPTLPPPSAGERISISVEGLPPYKDAHFSIRNPKHPRHEDFTKLRREATRVMAGRKWCEGPVAMRFTLRNNALERALNDYIGGIMDTLDGSHGETFTYLPIIYQDDCQICTCEAQFVAAAKADYTVEITFM